MPVTCILLTITKEKLARSFANLMFSGKYKAASDLLCNSENGGVLHLNDPSHPRDLGSPTVRDVLISKHPTGQSVNARILQAEPQDAHPSSSMP